MVNQINKKRTNLVRRVRQQKKAFKKSTASTSKDVVAKLNGIIAEFQPESGDEEGVNPVRRGRLGKGNTLIAPKPLSKKKLNKLRQQSRVSTTRAHEKARVAGIAAGSMDLDEEAPSSGKMKKRERSMKTARRQAEREAREGKASAASEAEMETDKTFAVNATGATLGAPGVMF